MATQAAPARRARISVRPLQRDDWPAIEALFGARGACGGCWCLAWRLPHTQWQAQKGAANKRAFARLVTSGEATGCLAFAGGEPVGWCSVGPRAEFRALENKRSLRTDWDERTWSVTCFFIRKDFRARGVSSRLLEAAVRLARERGATRVEGYPVVPSPGFGGRKMPAAFAWTGLPQTFERAGFRRLDHAPGARPIYVRRLRAGCSGAARRRSGHGLTRRAGAADAASPTPT
jgi:GNAT superfamily N-acetyltransferase